MRKTFLIFLLCFVFPLNIFADQEGIQPSYTAETADKKHIFVNINPECGLCWGSDKYRQSGMYESGSTIPLWTVDWQNNVFLPNDGKYVVRRGKWMRYSATYKEEVFSFVAEGKILKTYETSDLVCFPYLLPPSSSHYTVLNSSFDNNTPNDGVLMKIDGGDGYPLNGGVIFNDESKTMQIETHHGDKYLFDFTTGKIISSSRPSRDMAIGLFCALILAYFIYIFAILNSGLSKSALKIVNFIAGFILTLFLFLIPVISVWSFEIPFDDYQPVYPEFMVLCLLQISMFPEYLLTSLSIISQPENKIISVGLEAGFQWLVLFWLPLGIIISLLNNFFISKLSKSNFDYR